MGVEGVRKEKERELSLKHIQREKDLKLIQSLSKSKGKDLLLPLLRFLSQMAMTTLCHNAVLAFTHSFQEDLLSTYYEPKQFPASGI